MADFDELDEAKTIEELREKYKKRLGDQANEVGTLRNEVAEKEGRLKQLSEDMVNREPEPTYTPQAPNLGGQWAVRCVLWYL